MGVFAALGTALCWAIAARLFSGTGNAFSPLTMNFWKGLISIALLAIVLAFVQPSLFSTSTILWLLISGFIGIGIGDTCFFKALQSIGDSQAVLVAETLAPLFTALFAMAFIGEWQELTVEDYTKVYGGYDAKPTLWRPIQTILPKHPTPPDGKSITI